MRGQATCFGAGTIVNAIATGRGAAFGLGLRARATAEVRGADFGVQAHVPAGVDPTLAVSAARRVLERNERKAGLEVSIDSEIPISRGLKSSSAVANAIVLASGRALGVKLESFDVAKISVDAAFDAGVTITGAFDDACASIFGGICLTDNSTPRLLLRDRFPEDLAAVVLIPKRIITKESLKGIDFGAIRPQVEEALRFAFRGDYFRALNANSEAYAHILEIDLTPAVRARDAGALAAGITGTGPAILALAKPMNVESVRHAMDDGESEVRVVSLNPLESPEALL